MEKGRGFSRKIKDPGNLGCLSEENKTLSQRIYAPLPMFIILLFTKVKTWKQSKQCSLTDDQFNKRYESPG